MGGSRCHFRNCKVNSYKCNGMHFFRFPLKDKARCDLWLKYAHQYDLYNMHIGRQKNIVICARHFRDECFMNYKKDRLVATAVPTIHRLSKDKALVYELDINHGVLVTLPQPEKPHLIAPPEFVCSLGFDCDAEVSELLRSVENRESEAHFEDHDRVAEPMPIDRVQIVESIEIPVDGVGVKRPLSCLLADETTSGEGNGVAKVSRIHNHAEDDYSYITDDNIVISETSEVNSEPTIINHQIVDRLWLQSETFSLHDDADYQFVEIQMQPQQSESEQEQEIAEQLEEDSVEGDHISLSDDLQFSHKLEAASIEIEGLRAQLKKEMEKAKRLERNLSASRQAYTQSEQCVASLKVDITVLQNANEELESKSLEMDILQLQLEVAKEDRTKLEKELSDSKQEYICTNQNMVTLQALLARTQNDNDKLKKDLQNSQLLIDKETKLRQEHGKQLQIQQKKHMQIEHQLQQQIKTLETSLEMTKQQLMEAKNNLNSLNAKYNYTIGDRLVMENQLQKLQKLYDDKDVKYTQLESSYESLQKTNEKLNADYKLLESNQNQVSTVTTSNSNSSAKPVEPHPQPVLTKAQLFNGIKRYISSSMCSLLRMEMFGSSEREWKSDERQVAVDLLRLGEFVYAYLTDEWRFRLPALRDVRNWLNQSVAMNDEEDL